jgi:hypothetical protein
LHAQTVITNTRAEVSMMASLWEVDPIQISALANGQYPLIGGGTNTWQFLFPAFSTASDGDIHVNMAINSGGTGSTGGNQGESAIVPEVINATAAQLTTIDSLNGAQTIVRGIFRWYSEHTGERKYEIHPAIELLKWNGSAFVVTNDYRSNIRFDNGNTTQSTLHMTTEFDGSDIMTAAVMVADSSKIVFTYPSPRFNYCVYDGVALSGLTNDFVSPYFLLKPNLVPTAVIRCRLVTNTVAAAVAAGLVSNQTVTVNALTRCDLLVVSNKIAALTAGQTGTFTWPVEFITLNITNLGVVSSPPVVSSVAPSCGRTNGGTAITITGNNFVSGATVTIGGNAATGVGFVSGTTLTANTLAGTAGAKNVVVTNPSAQLGTLTNGFSYVAPVGFAGLINATPAIEAATLTWSAATGTGVTYNVYEGTASSAENFASSVTNTSALTVLITGLYPGSNSPITYFFIVRASDACGSSESNIVEKSVQPLPDPNKDQDGDGMPNGFEQAYGLNPFNASDASNDLDGDGFSNLQEYLAGTDPTNGASAFRITSVVGTGNDVLITWMTGLGRTNALQQTAGTGDGSYDTNGFAASFIVTNAVGTTTNYLDVGAATNVPARYYRVRLIP